MAYPDARIYQIGKRGLEPVAYEETDHYLVARRFLADPARPDEILAGMTGEA